MVCFVDAASVDRIIFSIFNGFNEKWKDRTLRLFTQVVYAHWRHQETIKMACARRTVQGWRHARLAGGPRRVEADSRLVLRAPYTSLAGTSPRTAKLKACKRPRKADC